MSRSNVIRDEVQDIAFDDDSSFGLDCESDPNAANVKAWQQLPNKPLADPVKEQLRKIVVKSYAKK